LDFLSVDHGRIVDSVERLEAMGLGE